MGPENQQPVCTRVDTVEHVGQRREVVQRLRHLLAADLDEAVMDPVPREVASQCDRLRPLVLVMREHQVESAAMQVEAVAQDVERHHDTLGVPARPARTPR